MQESQIRLYIDVAEPPKPGDVNGELHWKLVLADGFRVRQVQLRPSFPGVDGDLKMRSLDILPYLNSGVEAITQSYSVPQDAGPYSLDIKLEYQDQNANHWLAKAVINGFLRIASRIGQTTIEIDEVSENFYIEQKPGVNYKIGKVGLSATLYDDENTTVPTIEHELWPEIEESWRPVNLRFDLVEQPQVARVPAPAPNLLAHEQLWQLASHFENSYLSAGLLHTTLANSQQQVSCLPFGEPLQLELISTQPGYLTIINLGTNKNTLLCPSCIAKVANTLIQADQRYRLPQPDSPLLPAAENQLKTHDTAGQERLLCLQTEQALFPMDAFFSQDKFAELSPQLIQDMLSKLKKMETLSAVLLTFETYDQTI